MLQCCLRKRRGALGVVLGTPQYIVVLQKVQTMGLESDVIKNLRLCEFKLDDTDITQLEKYFEELRNLDDVVARASPDRLFEAQWSILGIIKRCFELMLCAIEQLTNKNWNGTYAAARGLAESLGAIDWVLQKTSRLPSLVQFDQVSIGKIMNAGYLRHPELREMYSSLSGIVHPGRDSHLLGIRQPHDPEKVMMSPFSMGFSNYFAKQKITILASLGNMICESLRDLVSQDLELVVKQGRVMMWRNNQTQQSYAGDVLSAAPDE